MLRLSRRLVATLATASLGLSCAAPKIGEVILNGEQRTLRERQDTDRQSAPETPPLLFLAFDGVSRDLLYDMLRDGKLPNLATLLGGDNLAHAYFDERVLSTLPSSTMAAWATMMTGLTPAEHGVSGNEYFVRETATMEIPAAVSFEDSAGTFEIYADDYMNKLIDGPTVYEKMKALNRDSLIWVAMHSIFRGADKLLMARRTVVVKAFEAFVITQLKKYVTKESARDVFEGLDSAVVGVVTSRLEKGAVPDVLTIYLAGTDLYAHVAEEGPDTARREYLLEVVEPVLGKLIERLRERNALANRWVVISSDHGHTEVMMDEDHAIDVADPTKVLEAAGFKVRAPVRRVDAKTPFDAVIASGGAMAYVYVANRAECAAGTGCPWASAPRYEEDVVPAAEALFQANATGLIEPKLRGTLDMILTRKPRPARERDEPFEVYLGGGKTQSIGAYLEAHPHPTYVELESRLRDLAVGIHGDRAGDILLLANNGNREKPEERFYFSHPYKSWHGSPSRQDSEIPLIVANPQHDRKAIGAWVTATLGERASQQRIADVLVGLRKSPPGARR